jgi:hypothetical protein
MSNEPVDQIEDIFVHSVSGLVWPLPLYLAQPKHLSKIESDISKSAMKVWLGGMLSRSLADSILSPLDAVKLMLGCPLFITA